MMKTLNTFLISVLIGFAFSKPLVEDHQIVFPENESSSVDDDSLIDEMSEFENFPDVDIHDQEGDFFQGDIKLLEDQKEILHSNHSSDGILTRTGNILEEQRWPKDKFERVIVPYLLTGSEFSE